MIPAAKILSREELHAMIWSRPVSIVAGELQISDVGLAKICKRLGVPRPERGYWQKIAAGMRPEIVPLPKLYGGAATTAEITPNDVAYFSLGPLAEEPAALIKAESLPEMHIEVPTALCNPHPLVVATSIYLSKISGGKHSGMRFPVSEKASSSPLDVRVSTGSRIRAMRILNALIRALESRGWQVKVKDGSTFATILGEDVQFFIWERDDRHDYVPTQKEQERPWSYNKYFYSPSGEITITLDVPWADRKNWKDLKSTKIEERLNEVVAGMISAADLLHCRRLEESKAEHLRLEMMRLRQEQARLQQLEMSRRQELDSMVESWEKSKKLSQFVDECRRVLAEGATGGVDLDWLRWARSYGDSLNPFINGAIQAVVKSSQGTRR